MAERETRAAQLPLMPGAASCSWCAQPATTIVIGTNACADCAVGGSKYRVEQAMTMWQRSWDERQRR